MTGSPLITSTFSNEEGDMDSRKRSEPCTKRRRKSLDTHHVESGNRHDNVKSTEQASLAMIDSADVDEGDENDEAGGCAG